MGELWYGQHRGYHRGSAGVTLGRKSLKDRG